MFCMFHCGAFILFAFICFIWLLVLHFWCPLMDKSSCIIFCVPVWCYILAPNVGLEGLGWHGYHMSSSITSVNFYHICKLCITSEPLKKRCSTTSLCEGDPFCFHLGKPAGIFYEHLYLSVLLIYGI